jgi:hypothetical protein
VEAETFGSVVAMAKLDDVIAEFAQLAPMCGVRGVERTGGEGVTGSEPNGQEVGERGVIRRPALPLLRPRHDGGRTRRR